MHESVTYETVTYETVTLETVTYETVSLETVTLETVSYVTNGIGLMQIFAPVPLRLLFLNVLQENIDLF